MPIRESTWPIRAIAAYALLASAWLSACGDESGAMEPALMAGAGASGAISAAGANRGGRSAGVAGAVPVGGGRAASAAGGGTGAAGATGSSPDRGAAGVAGGAGAGGPAGAGAGAVAGMAGAPAAGSLAAGSGGAPSAGASGGTSMPADDAFSPCPMGEPCKILPFGDSITFGIGYAGGYRVELFRTAHAAGKQITFLGSLSNGPAMVDGVTFPKQNEGHSGWTIDQMLPLIPMPALNGGPPHIILVMIGTNDIARRQDLANAPKRLGALLDKLITAAPDALIVVAKLTPLSSSAAGVMTYNDAIPALVNERVAAGKHVKLVDQFTGFPLSQLGDGVHPNQMGYERMAGVWYEAIGSSLR